MKTKTNKQPGSWSGISRTKLAVLAGILGSCALAVQAATPQDPTGDWDFAVSGTQTGVAFLTFNKDFTISGYEAVASRPPAANSVDTGTDTRGGSDSRNPATGSGSSGSSGSTNVFWYGYTPVSGQWAFDAAGRTVGFLSEAVFNDQTFASSFRAVVHPGKSMTFVATDSPVGTDLGHAIHHRTFSGVPYSPVVNLDGAWASYGSLRPTTANPGPAQTFTEILNLTNIAAVSASDASFATNFPFFTNVIGTAAAQSSFFVSGGGPGYTNFGIALISQKSRVGLVTLQVGMGSSSNSLLRAVGGTVNLRKASLSGHGIDDNTDAINYRSVKSPVAPAPSGLK